MEMKPTDRFVPLSDQIRTSVKILFDIFYFGETFVHEQLTEKQRQVVLNGQSFTYEDQKLLCDGKPIKSDEHLLILRHEELETVFTNKPKKDFLISGAKKSAVFLETDALISIPIDPKTKEYQLKIYPSKERVYYNDQLIQEGTFSFGVGDRLMVDRLVIEVREKQLRFTSLGTNYQLDPWKLVEETFLPEYPNDFPFFRRSPRIHLKEPANEIEILAPKPKETEGRNDLLKTIVPPLGMVVLSGATSFLSGGNPIMMLSMGGASLLTAGFSVSSYLTNKKETKRTNEERETTYRQYMLQKKSELNKLQQKQKEALAYMNPSIDDLAVRAKEYHARIYERMSRNEDFLNIRVGTGEIISSFKTNYQPAEEDDLSKEAEEQLVWPYKQLDEAPIVVPLKDQTLGLAGPSAVLRTAVQTILFQLSVLHSYRDVEFITLVPEADYQKEWSAWRWLPHTKIRHLNLRGIVHHAQSRDMVLNSFYQMLTKRRQQVKEAGNETVVFQPHYIFSILDESWLSGHGLNEFLAEDMSLYGVTVIWGKEALNMLPETTTTLIEY